MGVLIIGILLFLKMGICRMFVGTFFKYSMKIRTFGSQLKLNNLKQIFSIRKTSPFTLTLIKFFE
jgi:hypothetical protein